MARVEKSNDLALWALKLGVFGEFVGHGMLAINGQKEWVGWVVQMTGLDQPLAAQLLMLIGFLDVMVALVVLIRPVRVVLLWAVFWGFWTALLRPLVGKEIWDFLERWSNWGAPLALLLLRGWPRKLQDWLS